MEKGQVAPTLRICQPTMENYSRNPQRLGIRETTLFWGWFKCRKAQGILSHLFLQNSTHASRGRRGKAGLRGTIRDKSQDVAHVHRVGLQVGVGQVVGLLALQHLLVVIHKEDAALHADQVAQVGGSIIQAIRVFLGRWGRVEVCKTGLSDAKMPLSS